MPKSKIGSHIISENGNPYIIAEIGCNHNGDIELGKKLIQEAKNCGCDAVKFQLWDHTELCTMDYLHELDQGKVKLENVPEWKTDTMGLKNIFEQNEKFSINEQEHAALFDYARQIGIDYGTTVTTKRGVDFSLEQKAAYLKISSTSVTNLDVVEYALSKDIPAVISFGMSYLSEMETLVKMIPAKFRHNITLLHCTSIYPPEDNSVNLNFMKTLKTLFGLNVGYSDHTLGYALTLAAITLGASVIEKHFTLDKNMPGWDHKVSADPDEMKIICTEAKRIKSALGSGVKTLSEAEQKKRLKFRRSVVTTNNLTKGHIITFKDLTVKRPGTGIPANHKNSIIGRTLKNDLSSDKTLQWDDLV
ncbi:MAG: N-acetylneuraminate synthase family protein [Calditrichales bacterium]|nr:N-acetylneuraminate synthase family protein [Calditrichales bacterium]